ncbi:nicotinate-nucleotide adenylyltransferase [Lachnotalea glycerini]|jgi:nicotinate-nucleotide adenylyltransferase|uniref:Probable nicotinate-nucleotide adenylyltransferase n=1 Tax=Lachnotalea glycerini TaxID=1763509 RepID=A0A371JJ62_9FIRM|nr:nicotinate-nucleotide adenylyltransferase [Lachnotalea glycerini]RDY32775.1 nicotinate-nucleotide adenylyltransferase [Lachnotalea glycerini]
MSEGKTRIGIMGGTFDPIHVGHLMLAEQAYDKFNMDKILIMPAGNPPHKDNEVSALIKHRVSMVRLAIEGNKHFELSLIEVERSGYTYTYETLENLTKENSNIEYYFIIGADSLLELHKWKEPEKICRDCTILVATRYNLKSKELNKKIDEITKKYNAKIYLLDTPNIDLSSTYIRTAVSAGKSIKYYVTSDVERYIYKNNLYKHY